MNKFLKYLFIIFMVYLLIVILKNILTFFGIDLSNFLIYPIWIISLVIFYIILPHKYPTMSYDDDPNFDDTKSEYGSEY